MIAPNELPTIAFAPDGEVYISAEEKHGVSGALPEVSTAIPDRDIILCVAVWLLDQTDSTLSPADHATNRTDGHTH